MKDLSKYPLTETVAKYIPTNKVKLDNAFRFIYLPLVKFDDDDFEREEKKDLIKLYDAPLTISEAKISDLGDRSTGVLYFVEIPNIPHLLHHFSLA